MKTVCFTSQLSTGRRPLARPPSALLLRVLRRHESANLNKLVCLVVFAFLLGCAIATPIDSVGRMGDPIAQLDLGWQYSEGNREKGIENNLAKALDLFRLSATQGLAQSQVNLALMYLNGEGTEPNASLAIEWLGKAGDQEHADALCILGNIYRNGKVVPQNYALAMQLFNKAAKQELSCALWFLGVMYFYGEGVEKQPSEAAKWFWKVASQEALLKDPRIFQDLYTKRQGTGLKVYIAENALEQYINDQRFYISQSQVVLASLYEEGRGVSKNILRAYALLYLARQNRNELAAKHINVLKKTMTATEISDAIKLSSQLFESQQT